MRAVERAWEAVWWIAKDEEFIFVLRFNSAHRVGRKGKKKERLGPFRKKKMSSDLESILFLQI